MLKGGHYLRVETNLLQICNSESTHTVFREFTSLLQGSSICFSSSSLSPTSNNLFVAAVFVMAMPHPDHMVRILFEGGH